MTFLHLSLAMMGSLGIAIPVVLHFMMRQKPKRLPFPALRFLVPTHARNRRDFRLRNWLLLALRCALIALFALAFARPTLKPDLASRGLLLGIMGSVWLGLVVASVLSILRGVGTRIAVFLLGLTGLWTAGVLIMTFGMLRIGSLQTADQEAPVAAVLLLDLSPRMDYLHEQQSRLDLAKSSMRMLLKQLPPGSEAAILTTLDSSAMFTASPQELESQLSHLKTGFVSRSLSDSVPLAWEILSSKSQQRLELYIFSDLTQVAWNGELSAKPSPHISTYLIDVGVSQPDNQQITDLKMSSAVVSNASPLEIVVEMESQGSVTGTEPRLELLLEKVDPSRPVLVDGKPLLPDLVVRDTAKIAFPANKGATLTHTFRLSGLEPGTHHGRVRLVSQDGLPTDNERYFTCEVGPAWKILVIAGPGAESSFLTDALAPYALQAMGKSRFVCEVGSLDRLDQPGLPDFDAVALLDPEPLNAEQWQKLQEFVIAGNGLAVFLGRNATPVTSFQDAIPRELLPGKLTRQWRSGGSPLFLSPRNFDHTVLAPFREMRDAVPWNDFPVDRHWVFTDTPPSVVTILPFGNNLPALWERRVGLGRVITMATPISDPLNQEARPPWNRIPTGPDPWPYLVMSDSIMSYLCRQGDDRRNYFVGEQPQIRVADGGASAKARVFTPAGTWQAVGITDNRQLSLALLDLPGTYRIRSEGSNLATTGFSANLPAGATRLQRIEFKDLIPTRLPAETIYVSTPEKLERAVSEARVGRDVFPWLILAAALLLAAENVMANRFYPPASHETAVPRGLSSKTSLSGAKSEMIGVR